MQVEIGIYRVSVITFAARAALPGTKVQVPGGAGIPKKPCKPF